MDWTDSGSRVVYEHENPEARAVELVESAVEDWQSYEDVYKRQVKKNGIYDEIKTLLEQAEKNVRCV